jgi:hypothetical protein
MIDPAGNEVRVVRGSMADLNDPNFVDDLLKRLAESRNDGTSPEDILNEIMEAQTDGEHFTLLPPLPDPEWDDFEALKKERLENLRKQANWAKPQ